MAGFTSWADVLASFKDAIADRNAASWFLLSTENSREMRTMYTKTQNTQEWLEWLEMKASQEAVVGTAAASPFALGGG